MSLLNKNQILSADRKKTVDVHVKEWGGEVRLQELSASDRDMWESESFQLGADGQDVKFNPKHARARLVVRCLIGADGKRLFTDDEVAAVGSLSATSVQKLFDAARKLNAVSGEDMKELEGNSDAGPSGEPSLTSVKGSA